MSQKVQNLASILVAVASASDKLDSMAGRILDSLKAVQANTLKKFEAAVTAAYAENKWQRGGGRPVAAEGKEELQKVPDSVRVYISDIRAAYNMGFKVLNYASLEDLRRDLRMKRQQILGEGVKGYKAEALVGIQLTSETKLNGHVFHDLPVVYLKLGKPQREQLEQALQRVLKKALQPVRNLFPVAATQHPAPATLQ